MFCAFVINSKCKGSKGMISIIIVQFLYEECLNYYNMLLFHSKAIPVIVTGFLTIVMNNEMISHQILNT